MNRYRVNKIIDFRTIQVVAWDWRDVGDVHTIQIRGVAESKLQYWPNLICTMLQVILENAIVRLHSPQIIESDGKEHLIECTVTIDQVDVCYFLPSPESLKHHHAPSWRKLLFGF